MHLAPTVNASFAPLAWVAQVCPGDPQIAVCHGRDVEIREDWFCEAVWPDNFDAGDFDKTDIVAGSGGRIRKDGLTFVSSGSTVDRLCHVTIDSTTFISNSLPCLLAFTCVSLDPAYRYYFEFFFSIVYGVKDYQRSLDTLSAPVSFTYYENLLWNGTELLRIEKPGKDRRFQQFSDYLGFLNTCLEGIAANMAHSNRRRRYRFLGTLSSGYDSTTVAALGAAHGLKEVICINTTYGDRGSPTASALGLQTIDIEREDWRSTPFSALPFIAGDSFGEEVHFCAAQSHLSGRVLMTGYHGDKIWEKDLPYTSPGMKRGDPSGLAHTEYRLWAGYIHCPLPFWGARSLPDIHRISNSPEMQPWDIGGDYNRPVCRRIAEQAGVPRDYFGQDKSAASLWLHAWPTYLPDESVEDYFEWLRQHRPAWSKNRQIPPLLSTDFDRLRMKLLVSVSRWILKIPGYYALKINRITPLHRLATISNSDQKKPPYTFGFRRYVYPWAVSKMIQRYRSSSTDTRKREQDQ